MALAGQCRDSRASARLRQEIDRSHQVERLTWRSRPRAAHHWSRIRCADKTARMGAGQVSFVGCIWSNRHRRVLARQVGGRMATRPVKDAAYSRICDRSASGADLARREIAFDEPMSADADRSRPRQPANWNSVPEVDGARNLSGAHFRKSGSDPD